MVPKAPSKRRDVWTPAEAQKAISVCTDPNLKVCLLLSIGCSLRLGEILGLQWSHVHITEESLRDNSSVLEIRQELKRCDKEALRALEGKKRSNVYFTFPETKEDCKTSLVLKMPKTESSIRDIYIPNSVAQALQELQKAQEAQKKKLHGLYHDFNMVIAQPDGRPTEGRLLDKDFKSLIETYQLPPVVFHSLRHLSTSMKLQYSGGDIKAVQGDTGHAQASMVTQVYSHTFDENRRRVASLMEKSFFRQEKGKADKQDSGDEEKGEEAKTEADHKDESARNQEILKLLDQSPDLADLILALASSRTDRSSPATV
jgi:integrase